jgi:ABC-type antimicrobial peptide transport system permease subunit
MADGLRVALAGIALGGIAALSSGRWIGPLLFQQSPRDPTVFALAAAVLLGVAVAACCVPALRAAAVEPKAVLRTD